MEKTKPGYKTTEFWITIALGIAGVVCLALGKDTIGGALLAASGVAYTGSRGLAKMKRVSALLLAGALVLMVPGCCTGIDPAAIDVLVDKVGERHDAYVRDDESLSTAQRMTFLTSTDSLRRVVAASKKAQGTPESGD